MGKPKLTPPGWIRPEDERYQHPTGELRYLLFPAPTVCVRLLPDHGIEAAINRVATGHVCRVVVHKTVINFGHRRLIRAAELADKWIADYIEHQRKYLMDVRITNITKYRPFLPERI